MKHDMLIFEQSYSKVCYTRGVWFKTGLLPDLDDGVVCAQSNESSIKYDGNGYNNVAKLSIYGQVLRYNTKPKVYGHVHPEQFVRFSEKLGSHLD